jgi:hypothetical protein
MVVTPPAKIKAVKTAFQDVLIRRSTCSRKIALDGQDGRLRLNGG